ncbi:MAG: enoyl-CoA hydratase/isomerase family protein [Novosphingobium sp.]
MSEEPHMLVDVVDNILVATFNRPDKLNAMSTELVNILEEAVHRFRDTPELKVMLIKSKGRYFSSGADLRQGNAESRGQPTRGSEVRESHRRLPMRRIWDEMEGIEKPFVVAHHARCVGGSLEMSLSCDFRLAAASASYAFPEAKFGVLPATNGVSRLVRIIGPHWARYMIMANIPLEAEEARIAGLVHKVFPDESFEQDVMGFCQHLARQDGELIGAAKVAIELCADLPAHQAASVERLVNSSIMISPHQADLMKAHLAGIGKGKGY